VFGEGDRRITTDRLGSTVRTEGYFQPEYRYRYYPYGEQQGGSSNEDQVKFGTYWRDSVSGLDYAQNRYFAASQGRFTSADPYVMSGGMGNPQGWNRYAYVAGDPMNAYDPTGLDSISVGSCSAARSEALRVGGYANFPCHEDDGPTYSVTGTATQSAVGWAPGYVTGPAGMPDFVFDTNRPVFTPPAGSGQGATGSSGASSNPQEQSFADCMASQSDDYGIAGVVERAVNALTGTQTSWRNQWAVSAVAGNTISTLLYGSGGQNLAGNASNAVSTAAEAMGSTVSSGRRTTDIVCLNIPGVGGRPLALGSSTGMIRGAIGSVGKVLGLGLTLSQRLIVDGVLVAAEAVVCETKP